MFIKSPRLIKSLTLIVALCILGALHHTLSGPRLVNFKVTGDVSKTTIIADFNNILESNSTVSISTQPTIKNSFTINGNKIYINFEEPTKSNQEYKININEVMDSRGKQNNVKISFKTDSVSFAYLQRSQLGNDKIISREIGGDEKLIYEARRISQFAVCSGGGLLVMREPETASPVTTLDFMKNNGKIKSVKPPKGFATEIVGSRSREIFIIKTTDYNSLQSYLFLFDNQKNEFREITTYSGQSVDSSYANFASDGKSIIYQDAKDGGIYLADAEFKRPAINLGVSTRLLRYLPDNSGIFVESTPGKFTRILQNGSALDYKQQTDGTIFNLIALSNQSSYVGTKNNYDSAKGNQQIVFLEDSSNYSEIYSINSDDGIISSLTVNDNDEFIAVKFALQPVVYDRFSTRPEPIGSQTTIYNNNGEEIYNLSGTNLIWL